MVAALVVLTGSAGSWAAAPEQFGEPLEPLFSENMELLAAAFPETNIPVPDENGLRHAFRHSDPFAWCGTCEFNIGIGGTYHAWHNTGGLVLPMTVTWDRSRYELGLFRFARDQISTDPESRGHQLANPYWGASLSRRWRMFEAGPVTAFLGFGVSLKTEADTLSATRWNFAEQLAVRVSPESLPAVLEFSVRHWSNGGVKSPNRGQDFAMLTVRFER